MNHYLRWECPEAPPSVLSERVLLAWAELFSEPLFLDSEDKASEEVEL